MHKVIIRSALWERVSLECACVLGPHCKDGEEVARRGSWFSEEMNFADWRTEFRAAVERKWCIHDWLKFDPTVRGGR